ncbi:hypothetical protein P9112_012584 [Eukaryota sp. TZLM1-RC]
MSVALDGKSDAWIIELFENCKNIIVLGCSNNPEEKPFGTEPRYLHETGRFKIWPINKSGERYPVFDEEVQPSLRALLAKRPQLGRSSIIYVLNTDESPTSILSTAAMNNCQSVWFFPESIDSKDVPSVQEAADKKIVPNVIISRSMKEEFHRLLAHSNRKHIQGYDTTEQTEASGISVEPRKRQHK